MSQETITGTTEKSNDLDKLTNLFNEEIYVRVDANSVPVTKFKILDDLIQFYKANDNLGEALKKIEDHFVDHPESISAKYMIGFIHLIQNRIEETSHLKSLLEQFKANSKWTILEYVTDNILNFGEQRLALKYKAEALEKLNKKAEYKIVLEKLAKHDRKNPEIAKKYAMSILEEDKEKAIFFLKQAAESFARSKDYEQLEEIWPILVQNNFEDIPFFEKIERILVSSREKSRVVILLYPLMDTYKQLEDFDRTISLLKKILEHEPLQQKARNDLIRIYKSKYVNHSLLDEFLKMSEIGNNKKSIKMCITNFERNIVFDTNNYVLHRNWGVGKIKSISSETDSIIVDFQSKKEHKLSIQMAITSLKPLKQDHIWVKFYENKEEVVETFQTNVPNFISHLLISYDNIMTLSEIKAEITSKFIKIEDWSKWWNKSKLMLKKDPRIGFNPKKKDEIQYRQKPISLTEELSDKFNALTDLNKKLDIALEALDVHEEAEGAVESFNHFYYEEESSKDVFRKLVAYIYLDIAAGIINSEDVLRLQKVEDIQKLIRSLDHSELIQISRQLTNADIKKAYVDLLQDNHPEYTKIFIGILFEVPVKVNKYVFSTLVSEGKFTELNQFIETVLNKSKDNPEVFLWITKSILTGAWKFPWLKTTEQDLVLRVFRILKPLEKIEQKGTKLKNAAQDILFGNEDEIVTKAIQNAEVDYIRKIYAVYKEVPYITDTEKDKLYKLINKLRTNFTWSDTKFDDEDDDTSEDSYSIPAGVILVTRMGFNAKKEVFDHLANVVMPENSRDIGEAQEKGDLRENAEYKAAMEKQVQLQAEIKKLESELKSAQIIDISDVKTDKVNIGCKIDMENTATHEKVTYSILGAWDADTEKNIISYQSPIGKALLGKKVGDIATVEFEGNKSNFKVLEINRYSV
jgi:transcription elongation factor GreA